MKYTKVIKAKKKQMSIFIIFPCFVEWIITIIIYFLFKIKHNEVEKEVKNVINSYKNRMKYAIDKNIDNLCKKLKLKALYYENNNFEDYLQGIIVFFIPIAVKIIIFKKISNKTILFISSLLFYGIMFIKSFLNYIIIKVNQNSQSKRNNLFYYEKKYPGNNGVSLIKKNIQNFSSPISEGYMNFSSFFFKIFFGILFVLYFNQIGQKLDDPIKGCSWKILFIPIYISFGPIIAFAIIHCISLYSYFKAKIWFLIITIFLSIIAFIANGIAIPMLLEKRIEISPYIIPILFFSGTFFLGIHIKIFSTKSDVSK
jgi:hypothetical protein